MIPDRIGGDYAASCSNIELRGVAWTRTSRGVLVNPTLVSDARRAESVPMASEPRDRAPGVREAEFCV